MARPAFRAIEPSSYNGTSNIVGNKPTGTSDGDDLLAFVVVRPPTVDVYGTITTPSGWDLEGEIAAAAGGRVKIFVYSRKAGSSEPANWTWTWSLSNQSYIFVLAYSSGNITDVVDQIVMAINSTADATCEAPAITPTASPATRVNFYLHGDGVTTGYFGAGATLTTTTERGELDDDAVGGRLIMVVGDEDVSGTSALPVRTSTADYGSSPSIGISLLLRDSTWTAGASITDVDTDEIIANVQNNIGITGTGLGTTQGTGSVTIRQGSVSVALSVDSWSATFIQADFNYETGGADLKNGDATLRVTLDGGSSFVETPITIAAKTGELYVDLASVHSPSTERITTTPVDLAIGGQLEFRGSSGGAIPADFVAQDDGTYYFGSGVGYDFQARYWDPSDFTWGAWAVIYFTDPVIPEEPPPPDPVSGFTALTGQALRAIVESNQITVSGIVSTIGDLLIDNGSVSVNGASYVAGTVQVRNGDTIKVRHLTAAKYNNRVTTVVAFGSSVLSFVSTTRTKPKQGGLNILQKFYRRIV